MARKSKPKGMEKYRIISLRTLCQAADFNYAKLYNNLSGDTKSNTIDFNDRARLVNAAQEEMEEFFKFLGYKVKFERI